MVTVEKVIKNGVGYNLGGSSEMPHGSSSEHPSNPTVGTLYYNTDCEFIQFYNGESWIKYATAQGIQSSMGIVDVLLVGGGGGGGPSGPSPTGGGGGGEVVYCTQFPMSIGPNSVYVGKGGYEGGSSCGEGENTIFGVLTAYGGGRGGCHDWYNSVPATYCGSGGGGMGRCSCSPGATGSRNGGNGGAGCSYCPNSGAGGIGGGGGGGYGCDGCDGCCGGQGGQGYCSDISGVMDCYAGGGNGGKSTCPSVDGGGSCYGGPTKFGGGGYGQENDNQPNNPGCQGVVIVRYHTDGSDGIDSVKTFGGCKYTCGDYTIHCFTTTGDNVFMLYGK